MPDQFLLMDSQNTYAVPSGESRVGSDAACQICIRGEGVLPVHAYLRMDGEKLLIRPADPHTSSADPGGAAITVNGKPLGGPIILNLDQEIVIGTVRMRVGVKRRGLWSHPWVRRVSYGIFGLAFALFLAYLFIAVVLLDNRRLKEEAQRAIAECLHRDKADVNVSLVLVKLLSGSVEVQTVRVQERAGFSGPDPFLDIDSIHLRLPPWQLLGYCVLPRAVFNPRDLTDLQVTINRPKVLVQRSKPDGVFSIGDILSNLRQKTLDLGKDHLGFAAEVQDGSVRLRDHYTGLGDTALEEINIRLIQRAEGDWLQIEECKMKTRPGAFASAGSLELSGNLKLIDSECVFNFDQIASKDLKLKLTDFDLARIFEHCGYAWEPYGANFKVVLGKPISGELNIGIATPRQINFSSSTGGIKSASLISIREENHPPVGNIPAQLDISDITLADNGQGYRPQSLHVNLRSERDSANFLVCGAVGQLNPGGASDYSVFLQHCDMEGLCGTDVGKRLGLEGRLGGRLEGNAKVTVQAGGSISMDAKLESRDGYVMVSDPADAQRPAAQRKPPVRQPLPLRFECHASAEPSPAGGLSHIDIQSFSFSAPPAVEAKSMISGVVKGLGPGEKLEAHAQFKLNLKGREFWGEFAPILDLFGFTRPIQEELNLTVTIDGKDDLVSVAAEGTAARQWGANASPVKLESLLDYDAKLARVSGGAGSAEPYVSLLLRVSSAKDKPLDVRVKAQCSREEDAETIVFEGYDKERNIPLLINSDIVTLRERFQPYIEGYLQALDGENKNGWLAFYRDTALSGELEQSGRVVVRRMLDPKSSKPHQFSFDLNMSGKNLKLDMPLPPAAPCAPGTAPAAAENARLAWDEPMPSFGFKGNFSQRLSDNKEDPSQQRLDLDKFFVRGRLGSFELSLADLDVFKLANIRRLPNQTWADAMAGMRMAGQVHPPAFDLLRALRLLPADHPVSGNLAVQMLFDRQKDTLELKEFVFRQTDLKREFFLLNLDLSGALIKVRDLAARLLPARLNAPPFTENLLLMLQEGGPVAFLDHLGGEWAVNTVQAEMGPLVRWLSRDFQKPSGAGREPPVLLSGILNGDWRPEGTWKFGGVRLTRADPAVRKWSLVGARLRSDFSCYGAAPQPNAARPETFAFSHEWRLMMGLAVSQDNSVAADGDIILDDAYIAASLPRLEYEYHKPAHEPCKLVISDFGYAHGLLMQAGGLKLTGKPLTVEAKDIVAKLNAQERGSFSVGELVVAGGPLPLAASITRYEPAADTVQMRVQAPAADMAYLGRLCGLPAHWTLTGTAKNVNLGYRGSILAAQAMFASNPAQARAHRANTDPADPRLLGINPESDMLDFDAQLENAALAVRGAGGEDTAFNLQCGGQVHMSTRDLDWKQMSAAIQSSSGKNNLPPAVRCAFSAPSLHLSSLDARLSLMRALRAPGLPLDISGQLAFSTPVDLSAAAQAGWFDFLGILPQPSASGERRLAGVARLALSGSLQVPVLRAGQTEISALQVQDYAFKGLRFTAPSASLDFCGGKLALDDVECDLAKARWGLAGGNPVLTGIQHSQRVRLTRADLAQLLGTGTETDCFALKGRVDAIGDLKGMDFQGDERLSWTGAFKFKFSDLVLRTPAKRALPERYAPWAASMAAWGERYYAAAAKTAGNESVSIRGLTQLLPPGPAQKALNGVLLAVHVYLSKTFGVELEQYEFEAAAPTFVINRGGFAVMERLPLIGKGVCKGLDLEIRNLKINLAAETFADDNGDGLLIVPTAIPLAFKQKLALNKWPVPVQGEYLVNLDRGKLPLRLSGPLAAPVAKFPWSDLRSLSRRALFDADSFLSTDALEKGRKFFVKNWGVLSADLDAAAAMADRTGAGLPGTLAAREQGDALIGRVPGLPLSLKNLLPAGSPVLTPRVSLEKLLYPEPDPPGTSTGKTRE